MSTRLAEALRNALPFLDNACLAVVHKNAVACDDGRCPACIVETEARAALAEYDAKEKTT